MHHDAGGVLAEQADGLRRLHRLSQQLGGLRTLTEALEAVAAGARSLGFGVAVLNLVRADGTLETVCVDGSDEAREALLGNTASREEWDDLLGVGRHYLGAIWQDHREIELAEEDSLAFWVPPHDDGHDWHPLDALFVPLYAADGALLGTLSVDLPVDGNRPGDHDLELLGMFGTQASLALENALLHDELVAREAQLATALARTEALLQAAPVAIIEVDTESRVQRWNAAAERLFGWTREEVVGQQNPASADLDDAIDIRELLALGNAERVRLRRLTRSGRMVDVELSTSVVRHPDGSVAGVLGAMTDITETLRQEALLRQAAFRDPLTGCANRALLLESLGSRLTDGHPTSLLLVDLDGFKAVNDSWGHGVGDEVVVEIARRLVELPGADLVARLGGDEFVLLCGADPVGARLAAQVVDLCEQPIATSAGRIAISGSVGLADAAASDHPPPPSQLLRHADVALYGAKAAGRSRWRRYDPLDELEVFPLAQER